MEAARVGLLGHSCDMWEPQNVLSVRNEGIHFGSWKWIGMGPRADTTGTVEEPNSDSNCSMT